MKLGKWPKFQKLHIYSLSNPEGSKLSLFLLYGQRFPRYGPIFKIVIFGHETWQVAKVPEVAHIGLLSFYHRGSTLSLLLLYGQQFLTCRPISILPYLGIKLLKRSEFQKLHIYSLSTPAGRNWAYFCSTRSGFRDTGHFSNCHIWTWNFSSGQSSRSCKYTVFLHQGVEIELIFALRAAVSKIQENFQNCHIWAWNLASGQTSRSCT